MAERRGTAIKRTLPDGSIEYYRSISSAVQILKGRGTPVVRTTLERAILKGAALADVNVSGQWSYVSERRGAPVVASFSPYPMHEEVTHYDNVQAAAKKLGIKEGRIYNSINTGCCTKVKGKELYWDYLDLPFQEE